MFVKKSISNGRTFLVFAQGYRKNGKVRHKTIEKIGYLDDLKEIYDDPISHFKELAKQKSKNEITEFTIKNLNTKIIDNTSNFKNLGYIALQKIYKELGLDEFMEGKNENLKVKYHLNDIFSLLVFSRIMYPSSKKKLLKEEIDSLKNLIILNYKMSIALWITLINIKKKLKLYYGIIPKTCIIEILIICIMIVQTITLK